jgi:hypothetical protein
MSKKRSQKINKSSLQTFLWQEIVRLAFSPVNIKDKKIWINMLQRNLYDFWEIASSFPNIQTPSFPKFVIKFPGILTKKEIVFECQIDDSNKRFTAKVLIDNFLRWVHHFDDQYFTPPLNLSLTEKYSRKSILQEVEQIDIENVIKGLLTHPNVHQHIDDDIGSDDHEVRIGGGITNSFQYLFHIRYQLCPIKEKRDSELKRLIELFFTAIEKDEFITAQKLMEVPRQY